MVIPSFIIWACFIAAPILAFAVGFKWGWQRG